MGFNTTALRLSGPYRWSLSVGCLVASRLAEPASRLHVSFAVASISRWQSSIAVGITAESCVILYDTWAKYRCYKKCFKLIRNFRHVLFKKWQFKNIWKDLEQQITFWTKRECVEETRWGTKRKRRKYKLLSLHRALWNLYIIHLPTNALFIKLGKV